MFVQVLQIGKETKMSLRYSPITFAREITTFQSFLKASLLSKSRNSPYCCSRKNKKQRSKKQQKEKKKKKKFHFRRSNATISNEKKRKSNKKIKKKKDKKIITIERLVKYQTNKHTNKEIYKKKKTMKKNTRERVNARRTTERERKSVKETNIEIEPKYFNRVRKELKIDRVFLSLWEEYVEV
ncbi:hypothetical protein E2986_11506 [Frieseomelitta varia]|uniref:Uncharacterized protein n=1 Tax=Frieseomelitta varia TaxID=561572 RepID=A0A833W0R7_9HYME|nr:hypothetical protein E2986_11506 [Frieseomelitta varia]